MANLNILNKVSKGAHYADIIAPAGLEAGNIVEVITRNSDGTFDVQVPTAISTNRVAISVPVTLPYEASKEQDDYEIATGEITRVLFPAVGQELSFPIANFSGTPTSAEYVIIDAATYVAEAVANLGGTESVAYQIDELYTKAGVAMIRMTCVQV